MKRTLKRIFAITLIMTLALSLAACSSAQPKTYKITYNANTNGMEMLDYQFIKSSFGLLMYDSRIFIDITLDVDGKDGYKLLSDVYVSEGDGRCIIGDETGIGLVLTTEASGTYKNNENGTITIDTPTAITYTLKTDTYSSQMASVADISFNEDSSDGVWTLNDTPALKDMVPPTVFTVSDDGKILSYARVSGETGLTAKPIEETPEAPTTTEDVTTEDVPTEEAADVEVVLGIPSDDTGTLINLRADGTYEFIFESYSISDIGSYAYDASTSTLTLTDVNGKESFSTVDGDNVKFHYAYSQSDQLTGDYTIAIADLAILSTGATATVADVEVVLGIPSDDTGTLINLRADGTYEFIFESYSISDIGSYAYDASTSTLTLTDVNGKESVSTVDGDNIKFHYVYSQSDQLTGDYTIAIADLAILQ